MPRRGHDGDRAPWPFRRCSARHVMLYIFGQRPHFTVRLNRAIVTLDKGEASVFGVLKDIIYSFSCTVSDAMQCFFQFSVLSRAPHFALRAGTDRRTRSQ